MFKATLIHEAAIPRRCSKAVKLVQSIQLTYGSANNATTVECEMAWKKREHMDIDVIIWSHSKLGLLQKMLMWACREAGPDRNIWLYIKWNINGCALCLSNRMQASLLSETVYLPSLWASTQNWTNVFRRSWVHFFRVLNSTNILLVWACITLFLFYICIKVSLYLVTINSKSLCNPFYFSISAPVAFTVQTNRNKTLNWCLTLCPVLLSLAISHCSLSRLLLAQEHKCLFCNHSKFRFWQLSQF